MNSERDHNNDDRTVRKTANLLTFPEKRPTLYFTVFAPAPKIADRRVPFCACRRIARLLAYGDTCTGLMPTASGTPPVPAAAVYVSGGAADVRLMP